MRAEQTRHGALLRIFSANGMAERGRGEELNRFLRGVYVHFASKQWVSPREGLAAC